MRVSVELSLYPLREEYKGPIIKFVESLRSREDIRIETNGMSSQLFGDYDILMRILHEEMRELFAGPDKVVMVMKWVNDDLQGPVKF